MPVVFIFLCKTCTLPYINDLCQICQVHSNLPTGSMHALVRGLFHTVAAVMSPAWRGHCMQTTGCFTLCKEAFLSYIPETRQAVVNRRGPTCFGSLDGETDIVYFVQSANISSSIRKPNFCLAI